MKAGRARLQRLRKKQECRGGAMAPPRSRSERYEPSKDSMLFTTRGRARLQSCRKGLRD
jgi:hypothetical protein